MPTIYIDNKPFEVKAGNNLLESCLTLGFNLPYFCWHPALGSVGACRQCAVKLYKDEQDTQGRLVMSCMESVKEGLRLSIADPLARAFRAQVIEWLMTNHPHDCPVCDEGGSCHLQDMTVMTGHDYRRYHYKKRTFHNQYLGPFIHHEMNRCIQCYRCVRFYRDYAGGKDLNVFAAHNHVYFGREKDGVLQSPFSGNLAEICPTGVFTDKTLKEHYTRKWDLTTAPSVCPHCSLGCNIIAGERYGLLRNIVNRYNSAVNGYFLCDRGRFGYEFVNSENRISTPLVHHRAVEETVLLEQLKPLVERRRLIGIGSPRASMESNFSLMLLVGRENFYQGVSDDEACLERRIVDILDSGVLFTPSLKEIGQSDAVLILGEDIWNTAPIMALTVRQAVMKTAAADALQHIQLPSWHDVAVRERVQDEKGFLATCTIVSSPLDEISTCAKHATPDDIARLGFAIAHALDPSLPSVPGLDENTALKAATIAAALSQARHPIIISGTSCYNDALLRAAYDITAALDTVERRAGLSFVLRECNSLGLAMLQAPSVEKALTRVQQDREITAILLEQDLYRTLPAPEVETFFSSCKNSIVLDSLHSLTTEKADVLLPAASFAEADGTLVSNEGRAQRFFQVFVPANPYNRESWRWLRKMAALRSGSPNGQESSPDELLTQLETAFPRFKGISRAAPHHDFRIHGELIPREPHRYSGRTAMLANLTVSEPRPQQDNDSPLSYTMEGYQGMPPSPLIPFFWSPGWNSVQSVNKYQQEMGGELKGGDPGIRLFTQKPGALASFFTDIPEAFTARPQKWLLLPQAHVFGSGELSACSKAIQELSPDPYIALSVHDAEQLGAVNGSILRVKADQMEYTLPLKIENDLCNGAALLPLGLYGITVFRWGTWITIKKETT